MPATVWKQELLAGRTDTAIAFTLGEYLATIHGLTAGVERCRQMFGDRQVFDELRIDPFYRRIAEMHLALRPAIAALIEETLATTLCVVHADFSPKNVLLTRLSSETQNGRFEPASEAAACGISLVDFETGHFGDPALTSDSFSSSSVETVRHAARRGVLDLTRPSGTISLYAQRVCGPPIINNRTAADCRPRTPSHRASCRLSVVADRREEHNRLSDGPRRA
jgi:hypothetical protein